MPNSDERRGRILGGWLSTVVGGFSAAMIYRHPEDLHAAAWVAYGASAAFVFAGLTLLAQGYALQRTGAWLVVGCVACMVGVGAWVAFGPGSRACTTSIPFWSTEGTELFCRGVFGLGALAAGALLVYAVSKALEA